MQTARLWDLISFRTWTAHHLAVQHDTFLKRQQSSSTRVSITAYVQNLSNIVQNCEFFFPPLR